jgi:cephalosporin hydroxylase
MCTYVIGNLVKSVEVRPGLELTADEITFGYDLLFERNKLWAKQRWLGVQSQQNPSDAWIIQEVLYDTKPNLLIETGTQNGGGTLFTPL